MKKSEHEVGKGLEQGWQKGGETGRCSAAAMKQAAAEP